jgi:spore coat polysaccharide biosynthesis protein SpsF
MGSSRLPEKVLMPILGKPMLGWMLDRVSLSRNVDEIIVATSVDECDDAIEEFVISYGYQVFRGSQEDVLDRYYQAVNLLKVKPDAIVRLTGDCPILDPRIIDEIISNFDEENLDFISNSEPLPSSWPDGMDVSVMSYEALIRAWSIAKKPSEREHVTFVFWNGTAKFRSKRVECSPDLSKYRLTVDYPEDFEVIKKIIIYFSNHSKEGFKKTNMAEIVNFLELNPEVLAMNDMYVRGQGWESSFIKDHQRTPIPAVFLDRDGTINEDCGHIQTPEELVLLAGAASAICRLNASPYLTVVVTNQSVIARGKCTEIDMNMIHNQLQSLIGEFGASIDRIYYCPHYPDQLISGGREDLKIVCECRKPEPGLILRAAKEMNIDLNKSWMVGDMITDIEAANKAGVHSILLANQGISDNQKSVIPDAQCLDLKEAVDLILNYSKD